MRIIPAIDIIEGKCVRLTKGDYSQKKIYNENPIEVAKAFQDAGLQYLHLVDLDGAKEGHIINYKVLEKIVLQTDLIIDFGGGLQTNEDLKIAFESGANQITGGSIAVNKPGLFLEWLDLYGSEKVILGADVIGQKIATNAWQSTSENEVFQFISEFYQKGILYIICTDVSKDGMLEGASEELYQEILKQNPVNLIASGGITSINDLYKLNEIGCEGAIIGKAIYENKIKLSDLSKLNFQN